MTFYVAYFPSKLRLFFCLSSELEYLWLIQSTEYFCITISTGLWFSQDLILLMLRVCFFLSGQFFWVWLFLNILFFSAACISLVPETPLTALILDVPHGGPFPLLPQDPSPSTAAVTGIILKAPQVGLPSNVLLLHQWFSKCGPNQQHPCPLGTCSKCRSVGSSPELLNQKLWKPGVQGQMEAGICV